MFPVKLSLPLCPHVATGLFLASAATIMDSYHHLHECSLNSISILAKATK